MDLLLSQRALFQVMKVKIKNFLEASKNSGTSLNLEQFEVQKLQEVGQKILLELAKFEKQLSRMEQLVDSHNETRELSQISLQVAQTAVNINFFIEIREFLKREFWKKSSRGNLKTYI